MPSYAILGSTGSTGQEILKRLASSPSSDTTINAYARSKAKLEKLSPEALGKSNVKVFEGGLNNVPLLASCLSGTEAAFVVLGANVSSPGMRIAQEAAHSVVAALCHLRSKDPACSLPRLLFLSSAGVNPRLRGDTSKIFSWVLRTGLSYVYEDLELAQAYLELHRSWLSVIFVQPGGLSEDIARGHKLSTEHTEGFISYPDLAAGMIGIAESCSASGQGKGEFDWKGVAVAPASTEVKFNWDAPKNLIRGLVAHFVPWAYWGLRRAGVVI